MPHHFFICTNHRPPSTMMPSCSPVGGTEIYDEFVREIARRGYPNGLKVTATGCLTPCQVGPNIVVYPQGVWYCHVKVSDVSEIIETHLNGGVVERLLKPDIIQVW